MVDEEMKIVIDGIITGVCILGIIWLLGYQHWFPLLLILLGLISFFFRVFKNIR